MAGPPLVEAALGVKLTPEEIGPASVHVASGVIDVLVEDEAEAIAVARKYLGYFGGSTPPGAAPDGTALREVVPDNPRRAYNVRKVIDGIADIGSVLELKAGFGRAVVTSLIRIAGRPVGVVANQPMFLAGAIDSPASDKAAHFIQVCDAFDIPILSLCDTPGLMVGPDVERTGLVRKSARVLTAFANATVPVMTVVLRKAYGLGYYVMGSQPLNPAILLAWPTAEYGGMGLEGAVNIIYKAELDAVTDAEERAALHKRLTDALKRSNTAIEVAARYHYDDVIDPATRAHPDQDPGHPSPANPAHDAQAADRAVLAGAPRASPFHPRLRLATLPGCRHGSASTLGSATDVPRHAGRRSYGPASSASHIGILNGFARDFTAVNRDGAFSLKWIPRGAARYHVDRVQHRLEGDKVLLLQAGQPYEVEFLDRRGSESFCRSSRRRCSARHRWRGKSSAAAGSPTNLALPTWSSRRRSVSGRLAGPALPSRRCRSGAGASRGGVAVATARPCRDHLLR